MMQFRPIRAGVSLDDQVLRLPFVYFVMQASSLQPIENLDAHFFELSPLTTMVRWAKFSRYQRILRVACYLATKTPSWYSTIIAGKRFRRQKPVLSGRSPLITME